MSTIISKDKAYKNWVEDPLLSILITFGHPLIIAASNRNLCAASFFLLVSKKSTVAHEW